MGVPTTRKVDVTWCTTANGVSNGVDAVLAGFLVLLMDELTRVDCMTAERCAFFYLCNVLFDLSPLTKM